ncbi:hypothetical protein [Phenylobacterium deserti]|uniref:hypothetical protein n=1 Tax=Phenylobacterium deserti TaxID=1914756 RepID=UPI001401DDF9|nr:hypothetical protein [Phenylobacterium deserti]
MQDFRIYGLTTTGAVALSEDIPCMSMDELRSLAQGKLDHCDEVEVWQGPVRVLRLRRD